MPADEQTLVTDRRALTQIVINLANNAIKFTESGSVRLELARSAGNGEPRNEIRVIGTGVGIRPEDQRKLFQAFSQLDSSSSRRPKWAGARRQNRGTARQIPPRPASGVT